MKHTENQILKCVFMLFLTGLCQPAFGENEGLHVYDPVPGLAPSEFYSFRVRTVGSETWLSPHAFVTRCVPSTPENDDSRYYSEYIGDWSNTYINFETNPATPVEIEISKANGKPILSAKAHPYQDVVSCQVADGKAYVVIEDPALFTVDIDGQMDGQDTARIKRDGWKSDSFYPGLPIHTVTIFANPVITDKPDLSDPSVRVVEPGETAPVTGSWETLYFKPGVHYLGKGYRLRENKTYYIPGDAIVYGTLNNNKNWSGGRNIRIYGHGTLSGAGLPHPADDPSPAPDAEDWHYKPIDIAGAMNVLIEGITIEDSAMHSLMLIGGYETGEPNTIRWVKIFTWRGNGDGINPFGNTLVEDCFIRTQDDCTYVNGRGIRRVKYWTDVNGSAFVLSPIGITHDEPIIVEDCDILYMRSAFNKSKGGRVFNLRGEGGGAGGGNILFQNIRVHDVRPTLASFCLATGAPWQDSPNYKEIRDPGDITGIVFKNIQIAAPSIIHEPEVLWGTANARLSKFTFDNVSIDDRPLRNINDFVHNEYVSEMKFIFGSIVMKFDGSTWSAGPDFVMNESGWINAGPRFGWLNVRAGPWAWSHSFQSYIYLPGNEIRDSGLWLYLPN